MATRALHHTEFFALNSVMRRREHAPAPRIGREQILARCVQVHDRSVELRRVWIMQVFASPEFYAFRDSDTHYFSSADRDYDAVVISGDDVERLRQMLVANAAMLRRKLTICVMASSTARTRAILLKAGCDDVVDINRVDPQEAIARFTTMFARHTAALRVHDRRQLCDNVVRALYSRGNITRRSQILLEHLVRNYGKFVRFSHLKQHFDINHEPVSDIRIRSMIRYLSKHIGQGFRIEILPGDECRLTIDRDCTAPVHLDPERQVRSIRFD